MMPFLTLSPHIYHHAKLYIRAIYNTRHSIYIIRMYIQHTNTYICTFVWYLLRDQSNDLAIKVATALWYKNNSHALVICRQTDH